jgi:hypothetical protein
MQLIGTAMERRSGPPAKTIYGLAIARARRVPDVPKYKAKL